jgi:hypothetical protein
MLSPIYNNAGAGAHSNAGVINFELLVGTKQKHADYIYTRAGPNHYTFALRGCSRAENGRTLSAKCDCNQNPALCACNQCVVCINV